MALKKHISVLLFLIITLTNFPVYSWGTHYLVMARSLEHPSMNYTLRKVPVESIEKFIVSEKDGLDKVFSGYYEWMAKRGSTRFNKMIFDPKKPDLTSFLKAARLNPVTKYPLVNRILPGSKPVYRRVSGGEVSPYLKENKSGFFIEFEDVTGKEVSIRSILTTFVDEPDWNMDHHLWKIQEYGYGKQPYGKDEGESSKAPFHMQFLHENIIVRTFAPEIAKGGMMLDRIELFKRLADLAIKTNHPYWAYRFTAWATHYIQDLGQPYHSQAVPHAGWGYYLKFMVSSDKAKIKADTTQLVANRHFSYEDFVSVGLERSFTSAKPVYKTLASFLNTGEDIFSEVKNGEELMHQMSNFASKHSSSTDNAIVKSFGPKYTEDPKYDLENDPKFNIADIVEKLSKETTDYLLGETAKDFSMTGRGTRTMIHLVDQGK